MRSLNIKYISNRPHQEHLSFKIEPLESVELPNACCLDLETTGLVFNKNKILMVILGNENIQYVIDYCSIDKELLKEKMSKVQLFIGHNLSFDLPFLMYNNFNFDLDSIYDTMETELTLVKGTAHSVSLKNTVKRRLNIDTFDKGITIEFTLMSGDDPFFDDRHIKYAAEDILYLEDLVKEQLKFIAKYNQQELSDYNNNMVIVVSKMKVDGIYVNKEKWMKLYHTNLAKVDQLEILMDNELARLGLKQRKKRVKERTVQLEILGGTTDVANKNLDNINYGSSGQVVAIFSQLGLPIPKSAKEDKNSIGKATLQQYIIDRPNSLLIPFLNLLIEYKDVVKKSNTFGKSWLEKYLDSDGRVRASFKINRTTTGRLSCIEENQYVDTSYGYKKIKDIKVGDIVTTITEDLRAERKEVLAVLHMGYKMVWKVEMYETITGFDDIIATPDHLFRTKNGWKRVDELSNGDEIISYFSNENCEIIGSKKVSSIEEVGYSKTYDLTIDTNHNFIVNGLNVHNCSNPNLQQIPSDQSFRDCFEGEGFNVFWGADLSGAELKILASLSNDSVMLDLIKNDLDIHGHAATQVLRFLNNDESIIVDKNNNKEFRTKMKNVIFGLSYGASSNKIAELLDISSSKAEQVYIILKKTFPQTFDYLEKVAIFGINNGFVIFEKKWNGRRWFPEIFTGATKAQKSAVERYSKNSPIQGTNAVMLKKSMVDLYRYIDTNKLSCKLVVNVHDEVIIEGSEDEIVKHRDKFKEILISSSNYFLEGVEMGVEDYIAKVWTK